MLVIKDTSKICKISAQISDEEENCAKIYIKDTVDKFCKNNPGKSFSVRVLFGGDNSDWNGTPLQVIYNSHYKNNPNGAAIKAKHDVGNLLKKVLSDETNDSYEFSYSEQTNTYRKIN